MMPMPAPVSTSLNQCLLFAILISPVAVATVYALMPIHGLLCPYSFVSIVAVINAVAVCPEGKEWLLEPSGRTICVVLFNVLTTDAIATAENASDTSILFQELRPFTPAAFSPNIKAAGAYCR